MPPESIHDLENIKKCHVCKKNINISEEYEKDTEYMDCDICEEYMCVKCLYSYDHESLYDIICKNIYYIYVCTKDGGWYCTKCVKFYITDMEEYSDVLCCEKCATKEDLINFIQKLKDKYFH